MNYRTLASARETGRLSRRMRGALGQRLMEGGGSPAREQRERNEELAGRLEQVEGKVDEMGEETNRSVAAVQGEVDALRNDYAGDLRRVEMRLDRVEGGDDAEGPLAGAQSASPAGSVPAGRISPRRDFPTWRPWNPPLMTSRSSATPGSWSRNGGNCGSATPTGAGGWRGCATRSGSCPWSWPCWRSTG